jgi:RNase P subunit RPR2
MGKLTFNVKKIIGKNTYSFLVEGKNLHEVVMESKKLSFGDVHNCGLCNSNNLELSAHKTPDDGYEYVYIRCNNCKATLNFGQQKKNDDIYYLRTVDNVDQNGQKVKYLDWKPYVQ